MKRKVILIIALVVLACTLFPNSVYAEELYVCEITSGEQVPYGDSYYYEPPFYTWRGEKYLEGTYFPEQSGDSPWIATVKTSPRVYKVFKKISKKKVGQYTCSDEYNSDKIEKSPFTWAEYSKKIASGEITNDNKYIIRSSLDKLPFLGEDASESEILDFVKSDIFSTGGGNLEKLSKEILNKWHDSISNVWENTNVHSLLRECAYNRKIDNINKYKANIIFKELETVSDITSFIENDLLYNDGNILEQMHRDDLKKWNDLLKEAPSVSLTLKTVISNYSRGVDGETAKGNAKKEALTKSSDIVAYVKDDLLYNNGKGLENISKETASAWFKILEAGNGGTNLDGSVKQFMEAVKDGKSDYEVELYKAQIVKFSLNSADEIKKYVDDDLKNFDGKGVESLPSAGVESWKDIVHDAMNSGGLANKNKWSQTYNYLASATNDTLNKDAEKDKLKEEIKKNEEKNTQLYICEYTDVERKGNYDFNFSYGEFAYRWREGEYSSNSNSYALFKEGILTDNMYVDTRQCSDEVSTLSYSDYKSLRTFLSDTDNIISVAEYQKFLNRSIEINTNTNTSTYSQCTDGWWKCAWKLLNSGKSSDVQFGTADTALNDIKDMIFDVGNVLFLLVTAYLGVKYIWGGVNSKFTVKNSLMTLVVAAIVFYGWDSVTKILDIPELLTGSAAASGETTMVNKIYNTIMYIINFAAVGGIIYIGIRYMMAGADGKAELKLKGIPVVMGIMMVYGTLNFINFILKIVEGL